MPEGTTAMVRSPLGLRNHSSTDRSPKDQLREAARFGAKGVVLDATGELAQRADHRGTRLAVETGTELGEALRGVLDGLEQPGLAASLDPATLLRHGHDPIATTRALGPWVAHAYAPSGALDWEEYLGAL